MPRIPFKGEKVSSLKKGKEITKRPGFEGKRLLVLNQVEGKKPGGRQGRKYPLGSAVPRGAKFRGDFFEAEEGKFPFRGGVALGRTSLNHCVIQKKINNYDNAFEEPETMKVGNRSSTQSRRENVEISCLKEDRKLVAYSRVNRKKGRLQLRIEMVPSSQRGVLTGQKEHPEKRSSFCSHGSENASEGIQKIRSFTF